MLKATEVDVGLDHMHLLLNDTISQDNPVAFIHGLGGAGEDFYEVSARMKLLNKKILIPDLLGFGKSDKPYDFSYDLMDQVICLDSLFKKLGCEKFDIVAHSMGGIIAILYAKTFPHKIGKLVTMEPILISETARFSASIVKYGSEEAFHENYEEFVNKYRQPDNPAMLHLYTTLKQATYYALYRSAVSNIAHTRSPFYLEYLKMSTKKYFFKGENSYLEMGEGMIKDFNENNVAYYVVPGAGHGVMLENPEFFYAMVDEILQEAD